MFLSCTVQVGEARTLAALALHLGVLQAARPSPPRVPVGTLLYGEKGY